MTTEFFTTEDGRDTEQHRKRLENSESYAGVWKLVSIVSPSAKRESGEQCGARRAGQGPERGERGEDREITAPGMRFMVCAAKTRHPLRKIRPIRLASRLSKSAHFNGRSALFLLTYIPFLSSFPRTQALRGVFSGRPLCLPHRSGLRPPRPSPKCRPFNFHISYRGSYIKRYFHPSFSMRENRANWLGGGFGGHSLSLLPPGKGFQRSSFKPRPPDGCLGSSK